MNIDTYYDILEWQGEQPRKIDQNTGKEFGRKIYEKDIELGKVAWINNKYQDFKYYLFYHDPILSLFSNFKKVEWNEIFIIILFVLNTASILATATASIGFNHSSGGQKPQQPQQPQQSQYPNYKINNLASKDIEQMSHNFNLNETFSMIICSIFNGLILCIFTLKWRQFENKKNRIKLSTLIMNTNGITIIMFTLCALSLGYYFITNELTFFSWFLTIYALQFIFGWIFEIFTLYISFVRGWKYDHKMIQLIPNYLNDGSFSHLSKPKCIYYITYKDYEEWIKYKENEQMHSINMNNNNSDDSDASESMDGEHSSHQPLLKSANNTNNYDFRTNRSNKHWLGR